MDLSIIIVSWNVKEKLRDNLRAIYDSLNVGVVTILGLSLRVEIFVVDNNSADGTVEMVKSEYPQVKLIANQENLGFARANNQAIKQASGDFILLLNPDMKVFPDTLVSMVNWMKSNEQTWVAGCHLVGKNGDTVKHVRKFPGVWDQLAIVLKLPHILPGVLNGYLRNNFNYDQAVAVDSIRGGFFILRRKTIEKVGLLDERYFVWFEEVDYCRRVKQAGGEAWYTPAARCLDYVGQSFKQVKRGLAQKYFRKSQLAYFKKWQPVWQYWLLKLAWPIGQFITWVGEKINLKSRAKT